MNASKRSARGFRGISVQTSAQWGSSVSGTLLEVEGLSKRFHGIVASDDIQFAVREGELHAVIGPNGAGKTTLIGQLAGEIPPDFRAKRPQ